jgi:hypothetical protein
LPGQELCDDDWLYFVHGTFISPTEKIEEIFADIDANIGGGDYGKGFYTFYLCDDGELAVEKAKE